MSRSISSIVDSQISRWNAERKFISSKRSHAFIPRPVITISRLLGAGGAEVAARVADDLDCQLVGIKIVDEVIRRSEVRKELVDAMDEKVHSVIPVWVDKLMHRPTMDGADQSRYLLESISYFMRLGSVVMLGRGSAFAPRTRPRLDVRIVASHERRVQRIMSRDRSSYTEAELLVNESDAHRTRFVRHVFDRDWWDPREYDMVLNTDHMTNDNCVEVIKSGWEAFANAYMQVTN